MDDKAPDAFRTISEVADELDLPQHVLRFWESRFHEIKPMKRGGGRRYYRRADIDLLRGIRYLLYGEGYTIRGVQRLLREQGIKFVQSIWYEIALAAQDNGTEPQSSQRESLPGEQLSVEPAEAKSKADDNIDEVPTLFDSRREPQFNSATPSHVQLIDRADDDTEAPNSRPDFIAYNSQRSGSVSVTNLSVDNLHKLQTALDVLIECRNLITTVTASKGA